MEFYCIILFACPLLAFILRTIGQRGRHFYIARVILLSIAFVIAILFVIDYVSCLMAFAALSPIFNIEYSYEPHDVLIGAAFADAVLCSILIPRDILHYIAWRKRKVQRIEENKRQAEAVGMIKEAPNPTTLNRAFPKKGKEERNEKQETENEIQDTENEKRETRNEIQEIGYTWEVSISDKMQ